MEHDIRHSDPIRLAHMLEPGLTDRPWQPGELADVLRHQLAAPARFATDAGDGQNADVPACGGSIRQLLLEPTPRLELLQQLKDFAKGQALDPGHVLPQDIAIVLYYAAICAARLHCQQRITDLDDRSLRTGLDQLVNCDWLDSDIRLLFNASLQTFLTPGSSSC